MSARVVTRVVNATGCAFNVRLVRRGDYYGLGDCLVHDKEEPMIEFWDATYENDPKFTRGLGQFVSRYFFGTLTGKPGFYGQDHRHGSHGLDLCSYEPSWKLTGDNVVDAVAAVDVALTEAQS